MFIIQRKKRGKPVAESAIYKQKIELFTNGANPHELVFGGRILHVVGKYASLAAQNHAEKTCENIGIDFVRFFSPVKRGDILLCKAAVNNTWGSIIEVGIKVVAEDFHMLEEKKVLSAYFTYQAVDENNNPIDICEVIPETQEEMRRHSDAEKRKQQRKKKAPLGR